MFTNAIENIGFVSNLFKGIRVSVMASDFSVVNLLC